MNKPTFVYAFDADPRIDPPVFRISRHEALQRLAAGYVLYLSPNAVQHKPPPDYQPEIDRRGLYDKVWQPRLSLHYLVWQMRPTPKVENS